MYPPTVIQPNTWYFAAVTLTASGSLYLYWGPAGTTPVQLLAKTGLSLTNSVDAPQISTAAPPTYYSSLRYWTTTALIQAQVNAEALSLMPVNTAGLTYHFLSPQSTYLGTSGVVSPGSLLTDAVADGYALTNSSCLYSTFTPPTSQSVLSLPASGNNVKSASTILNPVTGSATTSGFVNMANGGFTTDANGNFPSLGGIVSGVSSLSLPAVTNNIKSATAILPAVTSGGATATGFVDIQSGGVTTDSGGLFPSVTLNSTMTTSALFLPATGNNVTSYSSAILPAISGSASATISGFVYSNTAGITTKYPSTGGKYPGISFTVTSTTITVWFNGLTYTSATVPAISANTWYFFAVTATNGSAPTLYWGTYGSVPTLYLTTGSGTQTSGADYIYIDQNGAGWSYACSFRYWTTKLLTQSQVNQEASSLVPVNTSGLTYHFLNTQSKSISDLTNNSYGAVVTLTNNSCTYSTSGPTSNGTFYVPSNNTTSSSYQIFPSFSNYASMSCFVYIAGSITSSSQDFNMNASYWPYFQTYGYTTVYVYFSVSGFSVTVPTIQPNTWYFGAVTGSPGGIVYLYWGPVGTTPTRYTAGTASSQSTAVSNVTISSFNSHRD